MHAFDACLACAVLARINYCMRVRRAAGNIARFAARIMHCSRDVVDALDVQCYG